MYIKINGCVPLGEKLNEVHKLLPEFMVRNKLSSKPQKAANKLKEMIEGPNSIVKDNDVSLKQDYSQGTVTLNLLSWGRSSEANGEWAKGTDLGQFVVCSTVLPATAAVERYTKALKDMVEKTFKEDMIHQISEPKKKWYQFWK